MFEYAGRTAHITKEDGVLYYLDIDNGEWRWEDWMFDPGYNPAVEPLSAIDAIIAMVRGKETLYDEEGRKHFFEEDKGDRRHGRLVFLNEDGIAETACTFTGLCRRQEKRKRDMTRWEILAWANSDESRGWFVRGIYIANTEARACLHEWQLPQLFRYDTSESFLDVGVYEYQRARLLPDLSGIDESTICGFEAEE
jgi:hypothetical protein